jgi:hypothetical protein
VSRLPLALILTASLGCPGDGTGGGAPLIINHSTPECVVFGSGFPSGFDVLTSAGGEAAVAQFSPSAVLGLDLESEPPRLLATQGIPDLPEVPSSVPNVTRVDSDSDGLSDGELSAALGFKDQDPRTGNLRAISPEWVALVTADHGNCEMMLDAEGNVHTAHTTEPVDFVLVDPRDPGRGVRGPGRLADVAPTVLDLMHIAAPAEMTGVSLLTARGGRGKA